MRRRCPVSVAPVSTRRGADDSLGIRGVGSCSGAGAPGWRVGIARPVPEISRSLIAALMAPRCAPVLLAMEYGPLATRGWNRRVEVTAFVERAGVPLRGCRLVLRRGGLVVVAAMVLLGAVASAEASAAPKVGRWVGVREDGLRVSFTIHSVGGKRFIANEASISGGAGDSPDGIDGSYAWPVSERGRIWTASTGLSAAHGFRDASVRPGARSAGVAGSPTSAARTR
jgi:hypothetical protein